jgi:hypothetical protein
MRRAASGEQSAADALRAAERLREAADLLGGMRQQQASDQLDSIRRATDRVSSQQREQAERMRQMFGQGELPQQPGSGVPREQQQLAEDRQRLAEEYGRLERQMQDAVRDLAQSQRAASTRLRDALGEAQQNDLRNRLQRSGDWIRRGMGAYSNLGEPNIAESLQRLNQQVQQAQQALGGNEPGDQQGLQSALERVERLRNQMDTLSRGSSGRSGEQGQRGGQPGQGGNESANGGAAGGYGGAFGPNDGTYGGWRWGRYGGAYNPGGFLPQGPERLGPPPTQEEIARAYQDAMRELGRLRQDVREQAGPAADIQELIREMQRLDPSRFPGNPALVEQLHGQMLATIDKVELELRRQLDDAQPGQIRSGNSQPVPQGYQESVAEYFRRLSKKQ